MTAKGRGIADTTNFIEYLIELALIYRDEQNKLNLTEESVKMGAMYRTEESGTWIIWKKNTLNKYCDAFKNLQNNYITQNNQENNTTFANLSLTQHQREIFQNITSFIDSKVTSVLKTTNIEDYMISLTGAAGTGKTFLTAQLVKYFKSKESEEYNFVVTSPTHKATGVVANMLSENKINASCKTIHSFLGIKHFIDYETGTESFRIDKTKKNKDTTSILIVDESSMVGSELFEYIIEAIESGLVGFVIFVGDPYQLLPVNNSSNNVYLLKNKFELKEVVRQAKDNYIIKIATELRKKIETKNYVPLEKFFNEYTNTKELKFFYNQDDFIKDFHKKEKWYKEDKIIATHKNSNVDAFNRILRTKFWEQKNIFNPPALLQGDMVRFIDAYSLNDVSLYHNGQIVELQSAILKYHESLEINFWECKSVNSSEQQFFRVVESKEIHKFNEKLSYIANKAKKTWDKKERKELWEVFYKVRDMFANVQYIHASTIHKLQGSTHDVAYVDLFSLINNPYMSDDEKYRLAYVSITRARYDVKLFMSNPTQYENIIKADIVDAVAEFSKIDEMLDKLYL